MAKWGDVDFKQLVKLQEKLNGLELEAFINSCAKELAARLLRKVIKRTLPGQYTPESGKKGGTLRRGWTAKTEGEAASGKSATAEAYIKSLQVKKLGNVYQIEIINPVQYASYVEFGHRTRDHKGWVRGKFMLTISEQELEAQAPAILEKRLIAKLREVFK